MRAVVGTGLNTIRSVSVAVDDAGAFEDVSGAFDNGDETVPGRSAAQGPVGAGSPLGDPIHVQYTCNVSHVAARRRAAGAAVLRGVPEDGRGPAQAPRTLRVGGRLLPLCAGSIGRADPDLRAAGAEDLDTAEADGLVDVMDLGPATLVVVDEDHPVTLRVPITNGPLQLHAAVRRHPGPRLDVRAGHGDARAVARCARRRSRRPPERQAARSHEPASRPATRRARACAGRAARDSRRAQAARALHARRAPEGARSHRHARAAAPGAGSGHGSGDSEAPRARHAAQVDPRGGAAQAEAEAQAQGARSVAARDRVHAGGGAKQTKRVMVKRR